MNLNVNSLPMHHEQHDLCTNRAPYRRGRRFTAVKVYTVQKESCFLLIQNVPAVGAGSQLTKLFSVHGTVTRFCPLDDFPADPFTDVYLLKYERIQSARFAKRRLDGQSFYGGSLHITYAPEHETLEETREKLNERRQAIAYKIKMFGCEISSKLNHAQHVSEGQVSGDCGPNRQATKSTLDEPVDQTALDVTRCHMAGSLPFQQLTTPFSMPNRHQSEAVMIGVMSSMYPPKRTIPYNANPPQTLPHHAPYPPSSSLQLATKASDVALKEQVMVNDKFNPVKSNMSQASVPNSGQWNLSIPPPPRHGDTRCNVPHSNRRDYGYAWVQSANASFPLNYDARLDDGNKTVGNVSGDSGKTQLADISKTQQPDVRVGSSVRHFHELYNNGQLIIRQYKHKHSSPKFVPRQVIDRSNVGHLLSAGKTAKVSEDSALNKLIRKEAFRLGTEQCASFPSDPGVRQVILKQQSAISPAAEESVINSVKSIRKRLSEVIYEKVPKLTKKN